MSPSIRGQSWVKYFLSASFQPFPRQLPFLDQATNSSQWLTFNSLQKLALVDPLGRQSDPSERKIRACPPSGANSTGSPGKALLSFQPHDPPLAPSCSSCNKHGPSLPLSFRSQLRCDFLWNSSLTQRTRRVPCPGRPGPSPLPSQHFPHCAVKSSSLVCLPQQVTGVSEAETNLSWNHHPAPRVPGTQYKLEKTDTRKPLWMRCTVS